MRMEDYLARAALRCPEKIALVAGGTRLSYDELDRQSSSLATRLKDCGAKAGDRIVFLLDNGTEAVICFFATWKLGGVACPLNPSTKTEKLSGILKSVEPTVLIVHARLAAVAEAACAAASIQPVLILVQAGTDMMARLRYEDLIEGAPCSVTRQDRDVSDLALIIHTSGTTGHPKGVMLSHANISAACISICNYLNNTSDDIVLSVLPLSFGYGITQMATMVMAAGTLVLERSFAFPRAILSRLQTENVTGFPLVPTMAALFCGIQDLAAESLPHLRYITTAAAAMPPTLTTRIRDCLPHTALYLMYGQTECLRTCYLPPAEITGRPLSVGKAMPGTTVSIVDDDGNAVAPGETGELMVRGPNVMMGYWRDEEATALSLRSDEDGTSLHTGDLFRSDEDGFLYFVARRDDMIKTRGEKVSPQEVERVLYALSDISEAAVEGVADAIFGQIVKAHVVVDARSELTERDILRHCAAHLEDYMVPKQVEFHQSLPKTATGKIRLSASTPTAAGTAAEAG